MPDPDSPLNTTQLKNWSRIAAYLSLSAVTGISLALSAPSARAQTYRRGPLQQALGASDDWTITAGIRPRLEAIDGQFRPTAARSDILLSVRSTLAVDYHPGPLRAGIELWDVRGYFEHTRSSAGTGEINALEPVQAYIGYDLGALLGAGTRSNVTVGRFTQDIGSRRLMARPRFRNTTNSFTGAKLDWSNARGDSAIAFWTMPQRRLPDRRDHIQDNAVVLDHEGNDLQFFGGAYTRADILGGSVQIYGFGLTKRDTPRFATTNRHLFTPGIRLSRPASPGKPDHDVEFAWQAGHARRTALPSDQRSLDVEAYMLHAEAGYTLATSWRPRIVLEYDLASGNGRRQDKLSRFDPLFGVARELSPSGLYALFGRANISMPGIRIEAKPDAHTDGFLGYRAAWAARSVDSFAATGVRDPAGRSGRFAGHQIEIGLNRWLVPDRTKFSVGGVYLAKGRLLSDAPNAPRDGDSVYGYSDITFNF